MISRSVDEPSSDLLQQKVISIPSIGRKIDAHCEPSPQMVDFLEVCFLKEGVDMGAVLKVSGHRDTSHCADQFKAFLPAGLPSSILETARIECGTGGVKAMLLCCCMTWTGPVGMADTAADC